MKKILILLTAFSLSLAGTVYFAYDTDDGEFMTLGYNYPVKDMGKWKLAVGANYDFDSASDMAFASIYALPVMHLNETMSVWCSLGYSLVADDGGLEDYTNYSMDGGMSIGFGFHYNVNESMGIGIGMVNHDIEWAGFSDTVERTNIYFSWKM